jgi:hypothetical protein
MLLALVDPMVIWKCIIRLLDNCSEENLALVQFFLDQSKFREYEENSTIHYPALALFAMDKLEVSKRFMVINLILSLMIEIIFYQRPDS